eukprot:1159454-Pelagomonas_calceolata.AAC.6
MRFDSWLLHGNSAAPALTPEGETLSGWGSVSHNADQLPSVCATWLPKSSWRKERNSRLWWGCSNESGGRVATEASRGICKQMCSEQKKGRGAQGHSQCVQ